MRVNQVDDIQIFKFIISKKPDTTLTNIAGYKWDWYAKNLEGKISPLLLSTPSAEINKDSKDSNLPLFDNPQLCEYLCQYDSIHNTDLFGLQKKQDEELYQSPLIHQAAMVDNTQVMRILFNYNKCGINELNDEKQTALMVAALHQQLNAIKFLKSQGADTKLHCNADYTAADYFSLKGCDQQLLQSLQCKNRDLIKKEERRQFLLSIAAGNLELTQRFYNKYPHWINKRHPLVTPHQGVWSCEWYTPLLVSLKKPGNPVLTFLLDKGANPNLEADGRFPLEKAIDNQDEIAAQKLIDKGAHINIKVMINRDYKTALFIKALAYGCKKSMVELFLNNGVDIGIDGFDPLHMALMQEESSRADEIAQLLLQKGATPYYVLQTAIDGTCPQITLDRLAKLGVNLSKFSSTLNGTPLITSLIGGHMEAFYHLIDQNVDISIRNSHGVNAFTVAVEMGLKKEAQLLLERGADPNPLVCYKLKKIKSMPVQAAQPFCIAVILSKELSKKNKLSAIQLLLDLGVSCDIQNNQGKTALDYACMLQWKEMIQLLEKNSHNKQ